MTGTLWCDGGEFVSAEEEHSVTSLCLSSPSGRVVARGLALGEGLINGDDCLPRWPHLKVTAA